MANGNNRVRVRDFLRQQGIDDSRIGFDERTKTATLDGREFYRGEIREDNRMYGDPAELQKLLSQFRSENRVQQQNEVPTPPEQPQPQQNQYAQQIQNILSNIQQRLEQPIQPFQYDPTRDPSYQAALQRISENVRQQQLDATARLMATGQGRSSYSETLARQLANRGVQQLETEVVPALAQQAYQRYMAEQELQQRALSSLMGLAQFASAEDQRAIENIFRERAFEAQQAQQEWQNRFQYGQAIGVFPSGQRTLAARQQEFEQQFAREQFEYQQARDAIMDERWKQEFDEDVRRFGLTYALDRAERLGRLDISRMQAQIAAGELALSRQRLAQQQEQQRLQNLYRQWELTGVAPEGIPGVAPGTPLQRGGGSGTTDYRNNPEFAADYQYILQNPDRARDLLINNAATFIQTYGYDGFQQLMRALPQEDRSQVQQQLDRILQAN